MQSDSERNFQKHIYRLYDADANLYKYGLLCYEWLCAPYELDIPEAKEPPSTVSAKKQMARKASRSGGPKRPSQQPVLGESAVRILCEYHLRRAMEEQMSERGFGQEDADAVLTDVFGSADGAVVRAGLVDVRTEEEFFDKLDELKQKWTIIESQYPPQDGPEPLVTARLF